MAAVSAQPGRQCHKALISIMLPLELRQAGKELTTVLASVSCSAGSATQTMQEDLHAP